MRVNRSQWAKIKLQWDGRLRAAAAFKGIKDYEEWAMTQSEPLHLEELGGWEGLGEAFTEFTPEDFYKAHAPLGEKEKLFAQAKEIREQINKAITDEDYEKADILQRTLDVIKLKYDKL